MSSAPGAGQGSLRDRLRAAGALDRSRALRDELVRLQGNLCFPETPHTDSWAGGSAMGDGGTDASALGGCNGRSAAHCPKGQVCNPVEPGYLVEASQARLISGGLALELPFCFGKPRRLWKFDGAFVRPR